MQFNVGDILVDGAAYYIFDGPDPPMACTNESSFNLLLIDEYVPAIRSLWKIREYQLLQKTWEFLLSQPGPTMGISVIVP